MRKMFEESAFSMVELVISLACWIILVSVLVIFTDTAYSVSREINEIETALSAGRMIMMHARNELKGDIETDSIQFGLGTAELSFRADHDEDGSYDTIEYFFDTDRLMKKIGTEQFELYEFADSSEISGTSDLIMFDLFLRNEEEELLTRIRTRIMPQ